MENTYVLAHIWKYCGIFITYRGVLCKGCLKPLGCFLWAIPHKNKNFILLLSDIAQGRLYIPPLSFNFLYFLLFSPRTHDPHTPYPLHHHKKRLDVSPPNVIPPQRPTLSCVQGRERDAHRRRRQLSNRGGRRGRRARRGASQKVRWVSIVGQRSWRGLCVQVSVCGGVCW